MHKGLQLSRCTTVAIMLGSRQLRYLLVADVSTTITVVHAAGVASCGVHGEVDWEWWGGDDEGRHLRLLHGCNAGHKV